MGKLQYPVLTPLQYDGKRLVSGDVVSLRDDQVERLQALKVVGKALPPTKPAKPSPPSSEKNEGPATPEARADAIREAVGNLYESDFTKSGKPGIEALEELLGWKTSRAEVTAAIPEEPPGE